MKRSFFLINFLLVASLVTSTFGAGINHSSLSNKQSDVSDEQCPLKGTDLEAALAYLKFKKIKASHMPSGVPDVYGQELNISFDKVQDAINKVRILGPTYGKEGQKLILSGENLKRYIDIGSQISCQYCCRAKTLVREDGKAACGCAHSIMMRGLSAYLIENHPDFTNEKILDELNTWKIAYFPKQTLTAKLWNMDKVGDTGIREIIKEFPDFLPKMVGGC